MKHISLRVMLVIIGCVVSGGVWVSQADAKVFQETNGLVVMDIESAPVATGWVEETTLSGYLGSSYYKATIDSFSTPGNGLLEYAFTVENAGEYQLQWRSRIAEGDSNTDFNDNFGRIVDVNGNAVAPIENNLTPTGTEYWYKIYMNTLGTWSWKASNHDNRPRALAWNLQAGQTYRFQVSYRSSGHAIDRILLWNRGASFGHNFGSIKGDPLNETLADGLPLSAPVGAAGYTYYALTDFPVTNANPVPYYKDNTRNALAIDATNVSYRDQFARAEMTFAEEAGIYDITITSLRELDGECTYRLYVNGALMGTKQNATTVVDYAPQNHAFTDVSVPAGATLAVESDCVSNGLVPESGGFAYARGRWTKVHLSPAGSNQATVSGEVKQWHKVMLSWVGPDAAESESTFMDYRLDVTFTHSASGKQVIVPGFYAADGDAGESSASAGNVWRVHFMPDEMGDWTYATSFRLGSGVAVSDDRMAGSSAGNMDGDFGTLTVLSSDKSGADFRSSTKGKLIYTGASYPEWMGGGGAFLKAGCNSPEVFLEYTDFDGTSSSRTYLDHIADWNTGDPTWKGTKGKGIVGVVNYISGLGINSHYFLTMNVEGDGKEAFPWVNDTSYTTYDVSKLDQWAVVFEHMMAKGVQVQFVLSEQENQSFFEYLDGGTFADSRKLYYREMVARFGYLNAITWNVGEENGWQLTDRTYGLANTTAQRLTFAGHLKGLLPYADNIAIHNGPSNNDDIYDDLLGDPAYRGISYQGNYADDGYGHDRIAYWRASAAAAGQAWIVNYDEPYIISDPPNMTSWRENSLWAAFSGGAAGVGYYVGSGKDLNIENYRNHETFWQAMVLAKDFFMSYAGRMTALNPDDSLVGTGWCLADPGLTYVIYLKDGGTTTLDLSSETGSFEVKWFDPRNGGALQDGSVTSVNGGGNQGLGTAPALTTSDWVVLVRGAQVDTAPAITTTTLSNGAEGDSYFQTIAVSDGDAPFVWSVSSGSLPSGLGLSASGTISGTPNEQGSYDFTVRIQDADGDSNEQTLRVLINPEAVVEPVVSFAQPAEHVFNVPVGSNLPIAATVDDPQGLVNRVNLYIDDVLVDPVIGGGQEWTWVTPEEGTHTLKLIATDDQGRELASATRGITVGDGDTLLPAADAFVRGGKYSEDNYGSEATLEIKDHDDKYDRHIYLRFDLSSVTGPINSAILRLKLISGVGSDVHTAYFVSDDSWGESTLTYGNKPAGSTALDFANFPAIDSWLELDVTDQVATEAAGDKNFSIVLISDGGTHVKYHSREAASAEDHPQLVIAEGASVDAYEAWATTYGGAGVIGSSTNDYDGDGVVNLAEYALGGNPTNLAVRGEISTFTYAGGIFNYVHPKRANDASLTYTVETRTNLVSGLWTNAGYSVIGTNVTRSTLNYVTNSVPASDEQLYIRLKVEQ